MTDSGAHPWQPRAALALAVAVLGVNLVASMAVRTILGLGLDERLAALLVAVCLMCAYLIPLSVVWLAAARTGADPAQSVALRRPRSASVVGWIVPAVLGAITARVFALAYASTVTSLDIRVPGMDSNPFSLFPGGLLSDVLLVLVVVGLAPFAEEVVFRGVLVPALGARWGSVLAVAGSSIVFALVHVNLYLVLPILVASLIFGMLFVRFDSLWPAYLCHALFNGIAVVVALAYRTTGVL